MSVKHTNRKGKTFHLHQGFTSKGNPKYYFSSKKSGDLVEEIPAGYEIHEKPDTAQVFLRKTRSSRITDDEREMTLCEARKAAGTDHILVEVDGDSLVIHFAERNDRLTNELYGDLGLSQAKFEQLTRSFERKYLDYQKVLRFTLADESKRMFSVERWCFKGSIDDWFPLEFASPLAEIVPKYCQHLGKESFFELM
ncbi:MAG TPA: hypothetical protein VMM56_05450 [Planctomycetaceae bacterium]|nr:hypothetical protein [Planctomycetaceae bacterium]